MKRPKAIRSEGREGVLGPGVPEEVRSSSGDSRSRFPLASNILPKTNTQQTTKKQTTSRHLTRTHLACRQARCGSIHILGPWSPGVFAHAAPLHGRSQLHFSSTFRVDFRSFILLSFLYFGSHVWSLFVIFFIFVHQNSEHAFTFTCFENQMLLNRNVLFKYMILFEL